MSIKPKSRPVPFAAHRPDGSLLPRGRERRARPPLGPRLSPKPRVHRAMHRKGGSRRLRGLLLPSRTRQGRAVLRARSRRQPSTRSARHSTAPRCRRAVSPPRQWQHPQPPPPPPCPGQGGAGHPEAARPMKWLPPGQAPQTGAPSPSRAPAGTWRRPPILARKARNSSGAASG